MIFLGFCIPRSSINSPYYGGREYSWILFGGTTCENGLLRRARVLTDGAGNSEAGRSPRQGATKLRCSAVRQPMERPKSFFGKSAKTPSKNPLLWRARVLTDEVGKGGKRPQRRGGVACRCPTFRVRQPMVASADGRSWEQRSWQEAPPGGDQATLFRSP